MTNMAPLQNRKSKLLIICFIRKLGTFLTFQQDLAAFFFFLSPTPDLPLTQKKTPQLGELAMSEELQPLFKDIITSEKTLHSFLHP